MFLRKNEINFSEKLYDRLHGAVEQEQWSSLDDGIRLFERCKDDANGIISTENVKTVITSINSAIAAARSLKEDHFNATKFEAYVKASRTVYREFKTNLQSELDSAQKNRKSIIENAKTIPEVQSALGNVNEKNNQELLSGGGAADADPILKAMESVLKKFEEEKAEILKAKENHLSNSDQLKRLQDRETELDSNIQLLGKTFKPASSQYRTLTSMREAIESHRGSLAKVGEVFQNLSINSSKITSKQGVQLKQKMRESFVNSFKSISKPLSDFSDFLEKIPDKLEGTATLRQSSETLVKQIERDLKAYLREESRLVEHFMVATVKGENGNHVDHSLYTLDQLKKMWEKLVNDIWKKLDVLQYYKTQLQSVVDSSTYHTSLTGYGSFFSKSDSSVDLASKRVTTNFTIKK